MIGDRLVVEAAFRPPEVNVSVDAHAAWR
jgi:hypothetical protein